MDGLEQIKSINTWAWVQSQVKQRKCAEHPTYKARRAPANRCQVCQALYATRKAS